MRFVVLGVLFCLFTTVFCKTNIKTLTESNGQEIIEIEGPKELPPGLDEEPGADSDEDDIVPSTVATTRKEVKKIPTFENRRNMKDVDKIDGTAPEEEEARLEKELAEIYKDNDYKDVTEETKETSTANLNTEGKEKPIARARSGFKFAPDSTKKADIEKFRTSLDDISCKNNKQKLKVTAPSPLKMPPSDSSYRFGPVLTHLLFIIFTSFLV